MHQFQLYGLLFLSRSFLYLGLYIDHSWEEFGIEYNSISEYITAYSLDGDRRWTATHIKAVLEDYDIIPNYKNVQKLINELFKLF